MKRRHLAALALLASTTAIAADLSCYEERGTRKMSCIDETAVRVNGDTRIAALYTGGPDNVRRSGVSVVANCSAQVLALQDRDGVIFGAGPREATAMSRTLYDLVCNAKSPKRDPKLRPLGK